MSLFPDEESMGCRRAFPALIQRDVMPPAMRTITAKPDARRPVTLPPLAALPSLVVAALVPREAVEADDLARAKREGFFDKGLRLGEGRVHDHGEIFSA